MQNRVKQNLVKVVLFPEEFMKLNTKTHYKRLSSSYFPPTFHLICILVLHVEARAL